MIKIKFVHVLACVLGTQLTMAHSEETDPAEIAIGERLTLETRFAQAYFLDRNRADPSLDTTLANGQTLPGAFAGKTMNCRACHMVDEHAAEKNAGMRSYTDFAARPPIPERDDNKRTSLRNSMSMVNISIPRNGGEVFHYDGEFNSMEELVRATFTGRNFGWLAGESNIAIKHIAQIIREDDGLGALAREFGGDYRTVLKGTASELPAELRLPASYRLDVDKASDTEIIDAVSKLVSAYVKDLAFSQPQGVYDASPYDVFLFKNNLPPKPDAGESNLAYNERLLKTLLALKAVKYVSNKDRNFSTHQQDFLFGEKELQGMKLFFTRGNNKQQGGNCFSCHTAPHFSDFGFHNSGLTQHNYDQLHGTGAFAQLEIPDLHTRNTHYNAYLPATENHPQASSRFRGLHSKEKIGVIDLGLWNVFANPDMPGPQHKLTTILCHQAQAMATQQCTQQDLLPHTIAAFKTPLLRDLGHSSPYMHNGQFTTLQQAVALYPLSATLARNGKLRNADTALLHIYLDGNDINNLVAFLKALNEDYE